MFYLLLAIICSSTIAFIFKYSQSYKTNQYLVTSANYLTALTISFFMIVSKNLVSGLEKEQSFLQEFKRLLSTDSYMFTQYGSLVWGILVGGISGVFFFLSFTYYQKSVKENGIGLSGTFSKLGILIPMIFSIIIWKEFPTAIQWIGIILSIGSIIIVNLSFDAMKKVDINLSIILLFIFGGMAEFSNKIYQKYALNDYKDIFLFSVFLVAFLISAFYAAKEKIKLNKKDILTGIAVGVPNLFSSYFLILSLETVKTSIAFPLFSAGSIVLINLGGFLLFKEKISSKNKIAIGLTVTALVLMNT